MGSIKINFIGLMLVILSSTSLASPEPNKPIQVLFIGNSLTYGNSLPLILEKLANGDEDNKTLKVEMVTVGGATLKKHWFDGKALKAIKRGGWDYVILQEHSTLGPALLEGESVVASPKVFHAFVALFHEEVQSVGAKTALMLPWAKRNKPSDQAALNKAYVDIAVIKQLKVIPVGPVWKQVRQAIPELELYLEDKLHPAAAGSYVAASVLYAHLLGDTIIGKSGTVVAQSFDTTGDERSEEEVLLAGISDSHALIVQKLALQSRDDMPEFLQKTQHHTLATVNAPASPKRGVSIEDITGEWSGELLFFRKPAVMSMKIYRVTDQWKSEQTILLNNGDKITSVRDLRLNDGRLSWVDNISEGYFTGVYDGENFSGNVRRRRTDYLESGSRSGSWSLQKQ